MDDMFQDVKLVIQYEGKLSHSGFDLHLLECGNDLKDTSDNDQTG
jgi:hypothetical protein